MKELVYPRPLLPASNNWSKVLELLESEVIVDAGIVFDGKPRATVLRRSDSIRQ